jgi:hypothetical protein
MYIMLNSSELNEDRRDKELYALVKKPLTQSLLSTRVYFNYKQHDLPIGPPLLSHVRIFVNCRHKKPGAVAGSGTTNALVFSP